MSNIKEIYELIDFIEKNNFKINILNIFLNFKDKLYLNKFKEIFDKFNSLENFNDLKKNFDTKYLNYKNYIKYIKIYHVLNKNNKNIILFNPNIYKHLPDIENIQDEYTNENKTLLYKIKKRNQNTNKLLNFLLNEENFINNFIKKQNTKTFIYTKLWKNDVLQNNENINLDLLNFKNNTNTKVYKEIKKYKIKKKQSIEFKINQEKILTNVRLSLPNTIIICFNDLSFVQLNKIVISNSLTTNNQTFNSFKEKIEYYIDIYKNLFDVDIDKINLNYNITIKKENTKHLKYNELVYKLNEKKILFSEENINIKYIKNLDELKEHIQNLQTYEEKFEEYKNKFSNYNFLNYLLYLNNYCINKFFDL